MGLMEIELAKLDYRERLDDAARAAASRRRKAENLRRAGSAGSGAGGVVRAGQGTRLSERAAGTMGDAQRREAKVDSPVLSIRLGRFRYRLWFTRYVAV